MNRITAFITCVLLCVAFTAGKAADFPIEDSDTSYKKVLEIINKRTVRVSDFVYLFSDIDTSYTMGSIPLLKNLVHDKRVEDPIDDYQILSVDFTIRGKKDDCSGNYLKILKFKSDSTAAKFFQKIQWFSNNYSEYEYEQLYFISSDKIYFFSLNSYYCGTMTKSYSHELLLFFAKFFSKKNTTHFIPDPGFYRNLK